MPGSRSSTPARLRWRNHRFTAVVLTAAALFSVVFGERITGVASASKPDKALKEVKAPKAAKPDSGPAALPVKALKPDRGHGHDDDDDRGGDDDEEGGEDEGDESTLPQRSQSTEAPSVVAAPVQSTPTPASQPPAVAEPTRLTGERPAANRGRPRDIRMRQGGGAARRSSPQRNTGVGSVLRARASGSSNDARPLAYRLASDKGGLTEGAAGGAGGKPSERPADKGDQGSDGLPVVRTVKDIVEVVPEPVKILLAALAAISVLLGGGYLFVAGRARRLDRQRADLLQEVGLLQTALLPPVPGTVGAVRTSVAYRPSDGPGAGGDFYDALTLPGGKAAFILGDVSGHGRQALARTAFARFTLRAYLEAGLEPRTALQVAGRVIDQHLDGHFATVVIAVHDPSDGSLTYACAGHPAPIVVGPTRPEPILAASSPPIGLELPTGVRQTTLPLPPGSVVCLYTDGLAESRTEKGILGRPRLADIVAEQGRGATAAGLLKAVASEARLVTDDMATVLISPTAGVTSGGFRSEQLEVDAEDAESGLAERFLEACEVRTARLREAASEARSLAQSHGGAVLHVRFGPRGAQVEVLPRNVESLEAASQRSVASAG